MNQKRMALLLCPALLLSLASGCGKAEPSAVPASAAGSVQETPETAAPSPSPAEEEKEIDCHIQLSGTGITADHAAAEVQDAAVIITEAGHYHITGALDGGQLIVDAGKRDEVTLHLEGADITSADGPALWVVQAGSVTVETAPDTDNSLTDGTAYTLPEGEDEPDGAVFAKDDLIFSGEGTLTVTGRYDMAVHGKDSVYVQGGTLTLLAPGDGLKGKDRVEISGGTLTVDAGGDGIQSNNDTEQGDVIVTGGNVTVNAGADGIKAEHTLSVQGGALWVTAGEDGLKAKCTTGGGGLTVSGGEITVDAQGDGIQSDGTLIVSGGTISLLTLGGWENAPEHPGDFFGGPPGWFNDTTADEESQSAKGLKAAGDMTITGGAVTLDTYDDAIHGDANVTVSGEAELTISSGDDGVHANEMLSIQGGSVRILTSYEGLEALFIDISGGTVDLTSADDGMNANGVEMFGPGFFGGFGGSEEAETLENAECYLHISGGKVRVNASGDGLDSNGLLLIEGGETYVSGPTNSGNGALDSGTSALVHGGIILAAGASGMDESFGSASTQVSIKHVFSVSIPGESRITLTDPEGNTLIDFTPEKQFNSVVLSHPDLTLGETYTLTCGDQVAEIEITDMVTSNSRGFGGPGRR